jgi:hypothetical protein
MFGWRKNGQGGVFDSANALNAFLEPLELGGLAANKNGLHAMMVIEVIMLGTEDDGARIMLDLEHAIDEIPPVVIVDHADDSDDLALKAELLGGRLGSDHGPQGVGPVGIRAAPDLVINQLQDLLLYRYTKTCNAAHRSVWALYFSSLLFWEIGGGEVRALWSAADG